MILIKQTKRFPTNYPIDLTYFQQPALFDFLEPVRGPERRLKSMSDEDADLDSIMLLDNLKEGTDEISCIKINNVPLELSLLQAIFEALKTTAKIKHLSLAGVSMKDEVGLVSFKHCRKNEVFL